MPRPFRMRMQTFHSDDEVNAGDPFAGKTKLHSLHDLLRLCRRCAFTLEQTGQIVQRKKSILKIGSAMDGCRWQRLFAFKLTALARFLAGLLRITPRDLFVPCRMKRPRPGFANSTASHRLERSRLANGAEIDVNENPAEHNEG